MLGELLDRFVNGSEGVTARLAPFAANRLPVRVEIEGTMERFMSKIAVCTDTVFFALPDENAMHLHEGDRIRAYFPGDEGGELRFEVLIPHAKAGRSQTAMKCKPLTRLVSPRRAVDRYNVRRFGNLQLCVAESYFRLMDESSKGCRILLKGDQPREVFPEGSVFFPASLTLGTKSVVELERLVPKN